MDPTQSQIIHIYIQGNPPYSIVHRIGRLPQLKTSSNEAGYWKVGIVKNGSSNVATWKYKAFKPGPATTSSGCMIKKGEGGGHFNTAVEAAMVLRTYCITNNLDY